MSFQKFYEGDTAGPPQREGTTVRPPPVPTPSSPAVGRKRPGVGTQTLTPLTF